MKRKLIIFPMNGNGLEALDGLSDEFEFVGFIDDTPEKIGRHARFEVFPRSLLSRVPDALVLAVPGSPTSFRTRRKVIESLGIPDERFARVVHPGAHVADRSVLGGNVLVMAGVVVSSSVRVGSHVCILPNSVVHHDASIGDYSLLGSGVSVAGNVRIGEGCYVGSGSSLREGIEIGDGALVGLGSTVIRSVPPGVVVAGNPAKPLR